MSGPPKSKAGPKPDRSKEKGRIESADPAQKTRVKDTLPSADPHSNGSVVIPIEISVTAEHKLEKPNIGWSHRSRGQNVERAIAIVLNPANQLTASAIIRKDLFMLRWLAALLLCEFLAVQWRRSGIVAQLQTQLIRTSFQITYRKPGCLFFSPLAFELTRSGLFDWLELSQSGEVNFFTTINVTVPQAVLVEPWLRNPPFCQTETPRAEPANETM